jgi:hypothetical protein
VKEGRTEGEGRKVKEGEVRKWGGEGGREYIYICTDTGKGG